MNNFDEQSKLQIKYRNPMDRFYFKLYSNIADIQLSPLGKDEDCQGRDLKILFDDGTSTTIQEKIRLRDYKDFLVEFYHYKNNLLDHPEDPKYVTAEGWYHHMGFDLMAYIVIPSSTVYLIKKEDIDKSVLKYKDYLDNVPWQKAPNRTYWTYNKPLQWEQISHKKYHYKI